MKDEVSDVRNTLASLRRRRLRMSPQKKSHLHNRIAAGLGWMGQKESHVPFPIDPNQCLAPSSLNNPGLHAPTLNSGASYTHICSPI